MVSYHGFRRSQSRSKQEDLRGPLSFYSRLSLYRAITRQTMRLILCHAGIAATLLVLKEAAENKTLPKTLKQYINPRLLIIDEWLLSPLDDAETKLIFELIHKRRKKSSTIFCSQFLDDGWYERIGSEDNPLSDSIMDRIKYDAYKINITAIDAKHDKSMREVYGLKASESH